MPQNNYSQCQQEFEQFREKLYQSFNYRRDTVMNLVDAIAANTTARSPVELCLSPLFPREYSAMKPLGINQLKWFKLTGPLREVDYSRSRFKAGQTC